MKKWLFFLFVVGNLKLKSQTMDTLTVKNGENLRIELEDQIGMGFYWQLDDTVQTEYLKLIHIIKIPGENDVDGGSQKREFLFKALKKGQVSLLFNLKRGKSPSQNPREKARFYIIID
jgi:predicted secreted protein